jgi:hypothetical protein
MKHIKYFESSEKFYTLYHGTSSDRVKLITTNVKLFLTSDEDVAYYYAAKGGEYYFMKKEEEFEEEYGLTPDEYYDTDENGELGMFKDLYPKNSTPVVIKFNIPKHLINDIDDFVGYNGGDLLVNNNYIDEIIDVDWNDLDY